MSLIEKLVAMLGAMESDALEVHSERCISVRNRNADCLRCVQACTSGVLSYRDNELVVEPERCIGCGTCATACPTCAIEMRNPTDKELTAQVKRAIVASKGHPVFACETALRAQESTQASSGKSSWGKVKKGTTLNDDARIVALPCLGRIDESLLVGLAAYKALDATLVCGECSVCPHAPGGSMVREVVAGSRNLLEAFGSNLSLQLVEEFPSLEPCAQAPSATVEGGSRRDFLKSAKDASAQAVASAVTQEAAALSCAAPEPVAAAYRKVGKNGTLSQFVPSRRVRLYNYLNHIGEPLASEVHTRIIGAVTIDVEKCSSCRMCAVFCPTGALAKIDEDETFGIMHRPSACMQCRLCESICAKDAIVVEGSVPTEQFMGKQAVVYAMKKPDWTPNKPSSMYDKVHSVIGDDLEMCMF